jgi:hypothetical protein
MKKILIIIGVILITFVLFSLSLYRLHLSRTGTGGSVVNSALLPKTLFLEKDVTMTNSG